MLKRIFCLCSILFLLFIFYSSAFAQVENVLKNADFEESVNGKPKFWDEKTWIDLSKERLSYAYLDDQVFKTGKGSLCIVSNKENHFRSTQVVNVKKNTYYRISGYIMTKDVPNDKIGANIFVENTGAVSRDIKGTVKGWEYVELYGQTGKEQETMEVSLSLGWYSNLTTGAAWFDDIYVEELDKEPAGVNIAQFANNESNDASLQDNVSIKSVVTILSAIVFILSACTYVAYLIFKNKYGIKFSKLKDTVKSENEENDIASKEKTIMPKITKKDIIIMSTMTLIYLFIGLYKLGGTSVPETYWEPKSVGDSFVLDLGKDYDISRISYYSGFGTGVDLTGKYIVEYLDKENKYKYLTTIDKKEIFEYKYASVPLVDSKDSSGRVPINTSKLKITVDGLGGYLNELAVFEKGKNKPIEGMKVIEKNIQKESKNSVTNLFDEQKKIEYKPSYMNSMYFDEIYHARTGYEFLHNVKPYENTHPPLGKVFISFGIYIFGMVPFGWRIVGTLFGVAMVPAMYVFGKEIFKNSFFAFCAAFLMMFDFMHFVQTRIATIDSYVTLFIIMMYYYMYKYYSRRSYKMGFKKSLITLLLCGIFFGLGAASKWIAVYGAAGLAFAFLIAKIIEYFEYKKDANKEKEWTKIFKSHYIVMTSVLCIIFFMVVPVIIYWASYIPWMSMPAEKNKLSLPIENAKNMYDYHSKLKATHPYESPWYEWPIMKKPMAFYYSGDVAKDKVSGIFTFGNPTIWWVGIIAFLLAFIIMIKEKDKNVIVLIIATLFQYVPWILIKRITFIYHYFSIVPFIILLIVYVIKWFVDKCKEYNFKKFGYGVACTYLFVVFALFVWFYPILSGMEVSRSYVNTLKWLKIWVF